MKKLNLCKGDLIKMFMRNDYPILEFDDNKDAKINPSAYVDKPFGYNKMVITFFLK